MLCITDYCSGDGYPAATHIRQTDVFTISAWEAAENWCKSILVLRPVSTSTSLASLLIIAD